jgi:DNA-binding response OmpR family regulator
MANILVIDDDDAVRRSIRRALELDGHSIVEAADGWQGLLRFGERTVDLVVTDILMPNREGIETIIELRRRSETLPIVAVSGGSLTTDRDGVLLSADLLGASRVLAKPFAVDELRAMVSGLLGDAPSDPAGGSAPGRA